MKSAPVKNVMSYNRFIAKTSIAESSSPQQHHQTVSLRGGTLGRNWHHMLPNFTSNMQENTI